MLLKTLIFQIFLVVVCAEEKCRLVSNLYDYLDFTRKQFQCDQKREVNLDYHETIDDEPYSISFRCGYPASSMYDLLPFFNVSDLEPVEELIVSYCQLPKLYSTLEEKFPNVFRLILEHTRSLENFFDKETNIEEIKVNGENVMKMENFPFLKMPKLRKIDLHWCGSPILVLKNDEFADIPHLTHVTIWSCRVGILPDTLFRNSTNIQHIDFSYNAIKHVPNTLFTNLSKLQTIGLSNNQITSIDL